MGRKERREMFRRQMDSMIDCHRGEDGRAVQDVWGLQWLIHQKEKSTLKLKVSEDTWRRW